MISKKRHKFSSEFRAQVVLEVLAGKLSVPQAAAKYKIKDSAIYDWRKHAIEALPMLFDMKAPEQEGQERIAELERIIGQLTVENDALKRGVTLAEPSVAERREIVRQLAPDHGGVAAMCRLMGLSENSYYHHGPGRTDPAADDRLRQMLVKLAGKHPRFEYHTSSPWLSFTPETVIQLGTVFGVRITLNLLLYFLRSMFHLYLVQVFGKAGQFQWGDLRQQRVAGTRFGQACRGWLADLC